MKRQGSEREEYSYTLPYAPERSPYCTVRASAFSGVGAREKARYLDCVGILELDDETHLDSMLIIKRQARFQTLDSMIISVLAHQHLQKSAM